MAGPGQESADADATASADAHASTVTVERRGAIALVTLSRPARLNAVTVGMVERLHQVLDELAGSTRIRVVVLTGAGRAFCAGMDITRDPAGESAAGASGDPPPDPGFRDGPPEGRVQAIYRAQVRASALVPRLREIPQPVVAALRGPVVGMGMSLALACDLRVADPTVRFVAPFLRLGFSGGDLGLSWLLPRLVGASRAAEILYRARDLDAAEAAEYGLIAESAAQGGDVAMAMELAGELAAKSPFGLAHTKELLNLSLDAPGLRAQLAVEDRTQTMAFLTEDLREGLTAALEKREARFRDR